MFTTFVRRTPPVTPETSPPSSPEPKCTCTVERCSRHHTGCNCPDCYARRWHYHGISTQTALQSLYTVPPLPTPQVALQYGVGGNIAYPYPIAGLLPNQPNHLPLGAPYCRPSYSRRHGSYRTRWNHSCEKHPCIHPFCVAKREKAAEEDKKKEEETEDKDKPCDCPNCGACQKRRKEEEKQKWWNLAVPGKEGVVVGLACVIL